MRVVPLEAMLWFASGCFSIPPPPSSYLCDKDMRCPDDLQCNRNGLCGDASSGGGDDDTSDTPRGFTHFPAGFFTRGCDSGQEGCANEDRPAATISLSSFDLQNNEVTQAEYAACVTSMQCNPPQGPSYTPASDPGLPVRGLAHGDAESYCAFFHARLPTEAEWERAARDRPGKYPWGNDEPNCDLANFQGCKGAPQIAAPTGGMQDLAGNVREWVSDGFVADFYINSPRDNPMAPPAEDSVVRGGSFQSPAASLLVWHREHLSSSSPGDDVGVRCARNSD